MTTGAANQNLVLDLWGQCNIDARYLTENGKQKENEKKKNKKKEETLLSRYLRKRTKNIKCLYLIKPNVPNVIQRNKNRVTRRKPLCVVVYFA